jgi:hypothetical protein
LNYIILIGNIESNPGPNIVSGKPNLKNGSLQIAHINACSLLPKIMKQATYIEEEQTTQWSKEKSIKGQTTIYKTFT